MPTFLWKWRFCTWDFNRMNPQNSSQNCINVLNYIFVGSWILCFFFFFFETSLGIILAASWVSEFRIIFESVQNNREVPLKWKLEDLLLAFWTEARKSVVFCYLSICLSCRWQRRYHFERSGFKAYIAALPVWLQLPAALKCWLLLSPEYIL